jgi:hypothetical protein
MSILHTFFAVPLVLLNLANVLYLASYLVRDILQLRALTVAGSLVLLLFNVLQPSPLWSGIAWGVLFSAINIYQIYRLLLERRPVRLREDEQHLYQLVFRSLSPRGWLPGVRRSSTSW